MYINEIKKVTEEFFGEKVIEIEKSELGLHNHNFIIETESKKIVAKIPGTKSQSVLLEKQHLFLQTNSDKLNIPKVFGYSDKNSLNTPVLFLEFINGKHIDFNDLYREQVESLAKEVVEIHSITKKVFSGAYGEEPSHKGTLYDYAIQFSENTVFKEFEKYSKNIKDEIQKETINKALLKLREELENKNLFDGETFSLLHTDIGVNNIIWKEDTPVFIDWGEKIYGDPADEVGYIFAINNCNEEFRKIFLAEYQKYINDKNFAERVKIYELKNRLFDVGWALSKLDNDSNTLKNQSMEVYQEFFNERYSNLEKYLSGQ